MHEITPGKCLQRVDNDTTVVQHRNNNLQCRFVMRQSCLDLYQAARKLSSLLFPINTTNTTTHMSCVFRCATLCQRGVHVMALCHSICIGVLSRRLNGSSSFGTELTLDLSYIVLEGNSDISRK